MEPEGEVVDIIILERGEPPLMEGPYREAACLPFRDTQGQGSLNLQP